MVDPASPRSSSARCARPGRSSGDVVAETVAPVARPEEQPGLCWLDGGEDAYRVLLHRHTSTDLHRTADPRHRPRTDRPPRRRVPGAGERGAGHRRPRRDLLQASLRRQPPLRGRAVDRGRLRAGAGQGGRRHGRLVRAPPQGRVRGPGDTGGPARLLLPARRRRQPARHVLHQHLEPGRLAPLRGRGHVVPRGHPGPPPAAGDRRGARRHRPVPQAHPRQCLCRGMGAVHRAPRRRDGALLGLVGADRHAVRRLDAGQQARRRHRPARPRVEPAAGDRLLRRQLADDRWR